MKNIQRWTEHRQSRTGMRKGNDEKLWLLWMQNSPLNFHVRCILVIPCLVSNFPSRWFSLSLSRSIAPRPPRLNQTTPLLQYYLLRGAPPHRGPKCLRIRRGSCFPRAYSRRSLHRSDETKRAHSTQNEIMMRRSRRISWIARNSATSHCIRSCLPITFPPYPEEIIASDRRLPFFPFPSLLLRGLGLIGAYHQTDRNKWKRNRIIGRDGLTLRDPGFEKNDYAHGDVLF